MQFQIECGPVLAKSEPCLLCKNSLPSGEARLIVCGDRGNSYGDICPHCIKKGSNWIRTQVQNFLNSLAL